MSERTICPACGGRTYEHAPTCSLSGDLERRANALLTEHHGIVGCDPNCEARYHGLFHDLTADEYRAEVGTIQGEWP